LEGPILQHSCVGNKDQNNPYSYTYCSEADSSLEEIYGFSIENGEKIVVKPK
jgi:hypothetical protein